MAKKTTQRARNLAKEMFAASNAMNEFGRSLIQVDAPKYGPADLRVLEERLFGALIVVRQHRHEMTNIIMREGQQT